MFRILAAFSLLSVSASGSFAQVFGLHDLGDLGGNRWGADVSIDFRGRPWIAGGISGQTFEGASLVFGFDPESAETIFTAPESRGVGRIVTFVNMPREQDQDSRFRNRAAPRIVGAFDPHGNVPVLTAAVVNVAFVEFLPTFTQGSGFFERVVIDTTGTEYAGRRVYPATRATDPTHVPLARFLTGAMDNSASSPFPTVVWYLFAVPEPASAELLLACWLLSIRRRRGTR